MLLLSSGALTAFGMLAVEATSAPAAACHCERGPRGPRGPRGRRGGFCGVRVGLGVRVGRRVHGSAGSAGSRRPSASGRSPWSAGSRTEQLVCVPDHAGPG